MQIREADESAGLSRARIFVHNDLLYAEFTFHVPYHRLLNYLRHKPHSRLVSVPRISRPKMAPQAPDPEIQNAIFLIQSLLNNQLKGILRTEGLPISGVKSVLQSRIIERKFPVAIPLA